MAEKRRKPGSPKGQSKPPKRKLDPQFPARLLQAMKLKNITVPELAPKAGCTRAVLHKYLNGNSSSIEALLLYDICDILDVSPRWLLKGTGAMEREVYALQMISKIIAAAPRPHNQRRGEPGFVERRSIEDRPHENRRHLRIADKRDK
jgi:transcriptional regulator with XRE-family HTH domain